MQIWRETWQKIRNSIFNREKLLAIFCWNFEIRAVQKHVNLVDLVKSFPTNIYLQKSASIQPRTSLSKFGGKFNSLFIRVLSREPDATGRGGSVKIISHSLKIKWTLRGSFSAVSTPKFASKYSLESSWRDPQDLHAFAPLRPQYFSKFRRIFWRFQN